MSCEHTQESLKCKHAESSTLKSNTISLLWCNAVDERTKRPV